MIDKRNWSPIEALIWVGKIGEKPAGELVIEKSLFDILDDVDGKEKLKAVLEAASKALGFNLIFRVWETYDRNLLADAINIEWRPAEDAAR